MTNQEVNEYLAEKLFGLKRIIRTREGWLFRTKQKNGGATAHDYCSNAMPVLEKLKNLHITLVPVSDGRQGCEIRKVGWGMGLDNLWMGQGGIIHEAICRATIEYLKAQVNS